MRPTNNELPIKTTLPQSINQAPPSSQAAILTGAGRSAVAVIGIRGPAALAAIESGFAPRSTGPLAANQIRYGVWFGGPQHRLPHTEDTLIGEAVVVTPLDAQQFEIHCHGGPAAAAKILADLAAFDVHAVDQPTWLAGQVPLLIAEAQHSLAQCLTARTAAVALDQVRGAFQLWCEGQRQALLAAPPETSLDRYRNHVQAMIDRGRLGTRLAQPFQVVLIGPPNVGKSSLVNALVGYDRSITLDIAGTTRDVLHAETVIAGLPIRFSDTAGLHLSREVIEQQGIERAKQAASLADLVIVVADPQHRIENLELVSASQIAVLNKVDLIDDVAAETRDVIHTVATTGRGVAELMEQIASILEAHFPPARSPVPTTQRQLDWLRLAAAAATAAEMAAHLNSLLSNPHSP